MEEGLIDYINQMGPDDQTEIIKFADAVEVVIGFSSDESQLEDAIRAPFVGGDGTSLYDAVYRAVQDISAQATNRKAILVFLPTESTIVAIPFWMTLFPLPTMRVFPFFR